MAVSVAIRGTTHFRRNRGTTLPRNEGKRFGSRSGRSKKDAPPDTADCGVPQHPHRNRDGDGRAARFSAERALGRKMLTISRA